MASSRLALKGRERKAPLPLLHLNEEFGTSSGVLGVQGISRRIRRLPIDHIRGLYLVSDSIPARRHRVRAVISVGKMPLANIRKWAHNQGHETFRELASLVGMLGRKDRIEEANEVSVKDKADVAHTDSVVEGARSWLPQGVAVILGCKLLPVGIIVSVGHGERGKERRIDGRCLITR
jgi:hypothetical protein